MHIELIALFSPIIGVLIFWVFEQFHQPKMNVIKQRVKTIASLEAFNLVFSVLMSLMMLTGLVYLLAPLQIFSFSNIHAPTPIVFLISFLCLDLISYLQHVAHHKIPLLWRLHRLHHSDRNVDAITALLHHPFELLSIFLINVTFAVIFDIPVIVLTIHALVVGFHSPFTHLQTLLPDALNNYLKFIFVTPNFHKIHHSLDLKEGNSNFGGTFVFWDYLFGTVIEKNKTSLNQQGSGIELHQSPKTINLRTFLTNPFGNL